VLDRVLAQYGPETQSARDLLRIALGQKLEETSDKAATAQSSVPTKAVEALGDAIRALPAQTDDERRLQAEAFDIAGQVLRTRWLLFEGDGSFIPMPFLVVLVSWITAIFASFGLFAPENGTVVTVELVCAMSVSASGFLNREMDRPFDGLVQISSARLLFTLAHLGE
jgi:hypothetical protein